MALLSVRLRGFHAQNFWPVFQFPLLRDWSSACLPFNLRGKGVPRPAFFWRPSHKTIEQYVDMLSQMAPRELVLRNSCAD